MNMQFVVRLGFSIFLFALAAAGNAHAQGSAMPGGPLIRPDGPILTPSPTPGEGSSTKGDAAGITVEPVVFYPGLDLAYGYDSNLFLLENNTRGSDFTTISPYVKAEAKTGAHTFDVLARAVIGDYLDSRNDNYEDYILAGNARFVLDGRTDLAFHAEAAQGHDARGTTDRPAANIPDEYKNNGVDATFGFGAKDAQGRVEITGGQYNRTYTNNRAFTAGSDRQTGNAGVTFLWRISPRTQLLAQGGKKLIDYDLDTSTQDSREYSAYVGARWEATAQTSGTAKFGRVQKTFDSAGRPEITTSAWELAARWSPLSYSHVDVSTSRAPQESTGVGDAIIASAYGAAWTHGWTPRINSRLSFGERKDDFRGVAVTRVDKTPSYGIGLFYDFRRWLKFGADYTQSDRDSNLPGFDYSKTLMQLTARFTL